MRLKGDSERAQYWPEQRWDWWRRHSPELAERALRWAERMELYVDQHRQIRYLAEQALAEVGGNSWSMNDLRATILILRDVWRYGESLHNWAIEQRYVRPD